MLKFVSTRKVVRVTVDHLQISRLMTITPLINRQIWVFSRPGLTYSEQRMLRLVLILSPIIFLLSAYITTIEAIPILYDIGHQIHHDYGFVAKYDAVSLIYFAIMLLWVQTLVIISSTVMVSRAE